MNENRDYITRPDENGNTNISFEVISTIAAAAVMEVEGVAGLAGNVGAELAGKISRKNLSKGIKVSAADGKLKIQCAVAVQYGAVIADVAKKIQQSVTSAIESMTSIEVESVNVLVGCVSFAKVEK